MAANDTDGHILTIGSLDPLTDVYGGMFAAKSAIPEGGTAGQVLAKASDDDYDTEWVDAGSGGGDGGGGGGTTDGPEYDSTTGEYSNSSIKAWLDAMEDGSSYGVSIPKSSTTDCTKLGANATIAAPTPGTEATAAVDPYTSIPTFFYCEVNATIDANGVYHVTGIQGDGRFARDGSNGNVWILTPVLYETFDASGSSAVTHYISKTQLNGMTAQPGASLPDGTLRPFILYPKYPLGEYNGSPSSVSGVPCRTFDVSHDTLITICDTANSGYAGKSYADDWYVKTMFLMKYATKDSQSVFKGCTDYNVSASVTVAESNVKRVIVSATDAAKFVVGSAVQVGTSSATSRNASNAYARITGITSYNSSNSAIALDLSANINTTTSMKVMTMPWFCGACDNVEGDGSPSDRTSGKEPFSIQGIEIAHGMYEILGDVILYSNGSSGEEICLNPDSRNEATSVTANYTHTGKYLPNSGTAAGWMYPYYPNRAGGLFFGDGAGATQTTGMCDGSYCVAKSTSGSYEWQGLGNLNNTGNAGLWYVNGNNALSNANWNIGSRLSGYNSL